MQFKLLGNCQVGGIADSLELLSNGSFIEGALVSNDPTILFGELSEQFKNQENIILMHESVREIIAVNDSLAEFARPENIYIPTISFAAFHPDIQYGFIDGAVVKSGLDSDWNSRILLWAYMNKLKEREARELFREEVYRELGYLDEWTSSAALLKLGFEKSGFDFGRWMRSVQRDGVFMYGINHPLPIALSNLAIQIVEREFAAKHQHVDDVHKYVTDYLAHIVWPVYPEIADELGVEGAYRWRVGRKYAQLDEFITLCYGAWDSIKLRKREINLMPAVSERDNVVLLQMSGRD